MVFQTLKRRGYVQQPTPLQPLFRFGEKLAAGEVWIKRDDLLPFGGNKTRKLDYLMQEAVDAGADTVITASTNQCCHNGILMLAANREGMKCRVVMESWGNPDYRFEQSPERELYRLAGAEQVETTAELPAGPVECLTPAQKMAEAVKKSGKTPWFISRGGAGPLGSCGYVLAAEEMAGQWGNDEPDAIVLPCGLGGTQAGLVVGLARLGCRTKVYGIGVTGKSREVMEQSVREQCRELTEFLGISQVPEESVRCVEGFSGAGYARPYQNQYDCMRILAETEGIITEPVYSGKALAGFVGLIEDGILDRDQKLIFLHTGGMSLYYDFSSLKELG